MLDEDFVRRIEPALRTALPAFGLDRDAALERLSVSENVAFRATGPDGIDLVLRVHRHGYHARDEILSELAWLEALGREETIGIPRPAATRDGGRLAEVSDGGRVHQVAAFAYLEGEAPEPGENLAGWFEELGTLTARLHRHARAWRRPEGFRRKAWTFRTTLGEAPLWGDWRAGLGLDAQGTAVVGRAVDRLGTELAEIGQGPDAFGLIHADLRLANLLVDGPRLSLIDFDDCGFSWFLYDFAAAVSFIEHAPYVPDLADAWMRGYRRIAPLGSGEAACLPTFVLLRRILLTAWLATHAETDTARALGADYTQGTVDMAEAFLSRPQWAA